MSIPETVVVTKASLDALRDERDDLRPAPKEDE